MDDTILAMRELSSINYGGVSMLDMNRSELSGYIVAGISPRSDEDNEHDDMRDEEDEVEPKVRACGGGGGDEGGGGSNEDA